MLMLNSTSSCLLISSRDGYVRNRLDGMRGSDDFTDTRDRYSSDAKSGSLSSG